MNQPANRLRPEIRNILNDLRRRIRKYVVWEGLALVVILAGLFFWLSLGLDAAWFKINKLELPTWFRTALLIVALCVVAVTFLVWVIFRSRGRFDNKNLALVLERQFPQLNDRLITAVEASEIRREHPSELSNAMLDRTVDDVSSLSRELPVDAVFEKRPLRRAIIAAAVLAVSVLGFGVLNAQAMGRWWSAFVHQKETYWERDTLLNVRVISQPGDRVREFEESAGQMVYRHARGADLSLLIDVPKGDDDKPWAVPDRVQLDTRRADGNRSRVFLSPSGEREYRFTINQLQDELRLWVQGNDYTNRIPYVVTIVDPPRVDSIKLNCDYPAYTGLNETGNTNVSVNDTQVTIPIGTKFAMQVETNKPLVGYRMQTDLWELILDSSGSRLVVKSENAADDKTYSFAEQLTDKLFQPGSTKFSIPMAIQSDVTEPLAELANPVDGAIPLKADSVVRIYVEDEDEIVSTDPARLTINGRLDQPPMVEVRRRGISDVITRKAVIPVEGKINDDYGVDKARFEFRVDDETDWRPRSFRNAPADRIETFTLQRDDKTQWEQFEVLPLDLKIGQQLTLSVVAEDADNLNGPHETRSEQYVFKIVSNEDLLSLLYSREVNLRRRFEQIIREVEQTRDDLAIQASRSATKPTDDSDSTTNGGGGLGQSPAAVAVRSQAAIRKNANETLSLEQSFGEILEELVNNAVHTRQMVDRIKDLIVKPMAEVNQKDYPKVDEAIGAFRIKTEQKQNGTAAAEECVRSCDVLIAKMKRVLAEIEDLAEFHEALKDLKNIIDAQQKVSEETKALQKQKLIDSLK